MRPIIFGEVLFDCFPDQQILGGAPFNVAWHLRGFGAQPLLITRIGSDARGQRIRAAMHDWDLDPAGVQTDPDHPTGTVAIELDGSGGHRFEIRPDQAYDHIDRQAALAAVAALPPASPLYHGSLAARLPASRQALGALIGRGAPRFVDVNLRAPWWDRQTVLDLARGARWVKLNDEEVAQLAPHQPPDPLAELTGESPLERQAAALRRALHNELLILTRGAEGASLLGAEAPLSAAPPPVSDLVDSVGAGDAFASVTLLGLLQRWPRPRILERALDFAAEICRRRGAIQADPGLYRDFAALWGLDTGH